MKLIFSMLFWGSPLIACIKVTDGTQSLMSVAQGEASTDLPACEGIKLAAVIDGDHAQCDSLSGPTSEEAEMRCRNSYDTDPYGIRHFQCAATGFLSNNILHFDVYLGSI